MTTLQKTFVAFTVVALAAVGLFEAQQNFKLRKQVKTLQQQQAQLTAQIQRSAMALNDATNQLAGLLAENARLKSNSNGHELLKLRGDATALRAEIAALRQSAREQSANESVVTGWANRISSLKQKLDQMPDKSIPEFAFLSDEDWAAVTRDANLNTDDGIRKALQALRSAAKENFLNSTRAAIRRYAASANGSDLPQDPMQFARAVNANGRLLPYEMAQLKPYYDVPVDDALLQRYQFLHPTTLHDNLSDTLVKEIAAPVDTEYDTRHEIGLLSGGTSNVNLIQDAINNAVKDFAQANDGHAPNAPAQVAPYLKAPLDPILVQKYLDKVAAGPAIPIK